MDKKSRCLKQLTEVNWNIPPDLQNHKYIGLGFMLRITEAVEAMAENHKELIRDRDNYEKWFRKESQRRRQLERKVSALRGHITRLKKEKNNG